MLSEVFIMLTLIMIKDTIFFKRIPGKFGDSFENSDPENNERIVPGSECGEETTKVVLWQFRGAMRAANSFDCNAALAERAGFGRSFVFFCFLYTRFIDGFNH